MIPSNGHDWMLLSVGVILGYFVYGHLKATGNPAPGVGMPGATQ